MTHMTNEPQTLGEVIRRVDRVEARQDQARDIYLRKDVYVSDQRADTARWVEHDKDHVVLDAARTAEGAFRRQVLLWGAGLTISTLVTVALFIASIMWKLV